MEIATRTASNVLSKIGEYTIHQGRFLCCFNNIVKDLKEEETNLSIAKGRMEGRVERAKQNTQIIKKDVEKWLNDASNILEEVQGLGKEIEEKKSCLSGWCPNCWCRYWLGRKAAKKTSNMLKLQDKNKFDSVGDLAPLPDDLEFLPPKDFELFQSSRSVYDRIIEALKNDKINLVGLYGMGGTGKTTMAKAVGKKVKDGKMFDKVIMVFISQTPNFKVIQAHLAVLLGLKLEEESLQNRARQLYRRFTGTDTETDEKKGTDEKILVILDDVWECFDLEAIIGIPFKGDHKGCKILLTTRLEQICSDMKCQQRIQLNVLRKEEGLALLKRHAGIGDDSSKFNDVAAQVARECDGLPLALVAIGSALRGKGIEEWKNIRNKLKKAKLEDIHHNKVAGKEGVYAILKESYDNLMNEKAKLCFLFCSIFPEDYEIHLEELLGYALGLGWYQDADSIEDARHELLSTLSYLKAASLLLSAGKEFVKMHDCLRDVALWIASKGKNVFMSKVGMELIDWSEEAASLEQYTAISSLYNKIDQLHVDFICPKLEILLLSGQASFGNLMNVSDECFKEMKSLKVLSLRYVDLSLKSVQHLTNLKTLVLIDCKLGDISYVGNLKRLEVLKMESSSLDELPSELGELQNLRLLNVDSRHAQLVRVPPNVLGRCSRLEELSIGYWVVEETNVKRNNASLVEVISLPRLGALYLKIDIECLPKDFAFPELQRYGICVNTIFDNAESHTRALKIAGIEATSLIAFEALYETLEYLCLENATGCKNILPSID